MGIDIKQGIIKISSLDFKLFEAEKLLTDNDKFVSVGTYRDQLLFGTYLGHLLKHQPQTNTFKTLKGKVYLDRTVSASFIKSFGEELVVTGCRLNINNDTIIREAVGKCNNDIILRQDGQFVGYGTKNDLLFYREL